MQRDVDNGRRRLNFQDWAHTRAGRRLQEIGRVVTSGQMPPSYYLWLHRDARLTAAEKQQLAQGLQATLAQSPPGTGK